MPTDPPYEEIIADLNEKCGKNMRHTTRPYREKIKKRWEEGYTLEDFRRVNSIKCGEWNGTKWAKFLKPTTLYAECHFDEYLNQAPDPTLSDAANKTLNSCRQAAQEIFDNQRPDGAEE